MTRRELLTEWAAVAVAILDVDDAGDARLDQRSAPVTGQRDRSHRRAVIAPVSTDQLQSTGDLTRDLDRILVGLRAAQREEHLREPRPGHRQQPLGQLGLGWKHR